MIVSNTSGALSYDPHRKLASEVESGTGVNVLSHQTKKPGCGDEIMEYFRSHPETGVTNPHQIAIVGDRLTTDMMLANMMGSWGLWVKDGVVPLRRKNIVSLKRTDKDTSLIDLKFTKLEQRLGPYLISKGYAPLEPKSPFE